MLLSGMVETVSATGHHGGRESFSIGQATAVVTAAAWTVARVGLLQRSRCLSRRGSSARNVRGYGRLDGRSPDQTLSTSPHGGEAAAASQSLETHPPAHANEYDDDAEAATLMLHSGGEIPAPAPREEALMTNTEALHTTGQRISHLDEVRHPLDALTADEINRGRSILDEGGLVTEQSRFPSIMPVEPDKEYVRAFVPGTPMQRRIEYVVLRSPRASRPSTSLISTPGPSRRGGRSEGEFPSRAARLPLRGVRQGDGDREVERALAGGYASTRIG